MKAVAILAFTSVVSAWGNKGHAIVGSIAQSFLDTNAKAFVNSILAETNGDMAAVASWADDYKSTTEGAFSKPLHFVDIKDTPPTECGFDEVRDCVQGNCINTAIQTYTSQLCDSSTNFDALRFLIHFFGDLSQPLHNSFRLKGGNGANVRYNGKTSNLHHVWDTEMVEDRLKSHSGQGSYVSNLIEEIESGNFAQQAQSWVSSHPYNAASEYGNNLASIEYSIDANKFDCDYVWPRYDSHPSQDIAHSYYQGAVEIIDVQLAKGGYRLAKHLNAAFGGCLGTPQEVPTTTKNSDDETTKVEPTYSPTNSPDSEPTPTPTSPPQSTCAHDRCSVGDPLSPGCDSCVDLVIAADEYCASKSWDQSCVDQVKFVCQVDGCESKSDESETSGCKHDICVTGSHLKKGCNVCADQIIEADKYCGKNFWNNQCVSKVSWICGISC
ncbi:hypothetical protein HDV06_000301 [Boothiomyces sp. JEL0866]|nr:hypothetical protein HDV06_000301 [Boothiomyces sp. JEL0866]